MSNRTRTLAKPRKFTLIAHTQRAVHRLILPTVLYIFHNIPSHAGGNVVFRGIQ